jgi:hypothetical protein
MYVFCSWRKKEADLIDLMDKKEPDAFERLNGYSWDLVVVFKHPKKTFGTDVPIRSAKSYNHYNYCLINGKYVDISMP